MVEGTGEKVPGAAAEKVVERRAAVAWATSEGGMWRYVLGSFA